MIPTCSQGWRPRCWGCRGTLQLCLRVCIVPSFPWPRYLASLRGHVAAVYQIAWSADSRLLVSGSSDSTLKVWDVKARKLAADLPGHADEVRPPPSGAGWVWG